MRSLIRQLDAKSGLILTEPSVVFAWQKNRMNIAMSAPERRRAGNRDGPLIFHMRDGPLNVTGPTGGTEPPEIFSSGFTPPRILSHTVKWLARK
jgi:hypothetical protein